MWRKTRNIGFGFGFGSKNQIKIEEKRYYLRNIMVLDAQQTYNIGLKCQIVSCIINTLASLLTLYVIYWLPKSYHNGYLTMILIMTISQTFYDTSLFFYSAPEGAPGYFDLLDTSFYLGILFGINSSFWTCIISGVTSYVIWTRKYVAVQSNIIYFIIVNFILSFVIATSFIVPYVRHEEYAVTVTFGIYNYARLLIIIFDMLAINLIFIVLKSLQQKNMANKGEIDSSYYPMYILAKRLMLYPLVQTISRIPVTIYQLHYNETVSQYPTGPHPDTFKTALLFIGFWCTPLSGLGNCIVFFAMQKGAWKTFKEKVLCQESATGLSEQEEVAKPESSINRGKSWKSSSLSAGNSNKSGSLGIGNSISSSNNSIGGIKSWVSRSLSKNNMTAEQIVMNEEEWRRFDDLDDEELSKAVGTAYRESLSRNSEIRNSQGSRVEL